MWEEALMFISPKNQLLQPVTAWKWWFPSYLVGKMTFYRIIRRLDISKIFCWLWYFTTVHKSMHIPLVSPKVTQKVDWKCTYFAQIDYILVLAALTRAVGWKSTAMREISTHMICFPVHKSMPIRCPNPQPSVVKNWSQKNFFWDT